jgi:hypothetical protein
MSRQIEQGLRVEFFRADRPARYAAPHTEQFNTVWRAFGQDQARFLFKCIPKPELELG